MAEGFDRAQSAIVAVAESTVATIGQLGVRYARMRWRSSSGVKFSAQGNVIVAGAAGEATLEVTLTYQRRPHETDDSGEAGGDDG